MNVTARLSKDHLAIFLFHGVVEKSEYRLRNYIRKHIEKDYFRNILQGLKREGSPLSMDEIVERHRSGKVYPPRSFAITFDDGFENNFSIAAPILKALSLPATFYINTDFVENNRMSWTDRVEYCLERVPKGKVSLPWKEEPFFFEDIKRKKHFMEYIRFQWRKNSTLDWDKIVSSIFSQCGVKEIEGSDGPIDLKMSWNQIRELSKYELFTIGGHGHRHLNMARLKENDLEREIDTSIRLLKERADIAPIHYSYPEGLDFCYSDVVIEALKKRGVICCPTAIDGVNSISEGIFHLKRIMVT